MDSPLIEIRARISHSVRYSIIDRSLTWLREWSSLLPPCPLRKPMLMPSPPILRPFTFIPDHRAFFRIALVTATTRSVRNEYTHILSQIPSVLQFPSYLLSQHVQVDTTWVQIWYDVQWRRQLQTSCVQELYVDQARTPEAQQLVAALVSLLGMLLWCWTLWKRDPRFIIYICIQQWFRNTGAG